MNIQKILAPTDFSELSEAAVERAIEFAAQFGADVTLLHAYGLPVYVFGDGAVIPPPQTLADLISGIDDQLKALREKVQRPGVKIGICSLQGPPAQAILDYASEQHVDLIVIGTHGRTGFRRLALGSVAEHVVRGAIVPVLTVHPKVEANSTAFTTPPLP